jgi:RHS repeat-associated protein
VQKIVRGGWNGSWFTAILSIRKYLYDGWNVIAEFDATGTLTLVRSHTWGLDLTGSPAASGGVGALLQTYDHAAAKTYLASYDGNGNVAALFNADSGAFAAVYEYGPSGEPLRAEILDSAIAGQPFRFSTKFTDAETGLVYYGHRYYSATLGRFINRDPSEEQGGINLYGFCGNDGINGRDYLGLDAYLVFDGGAWRDGGDFQFARSNNGQVLLDLPGKILNGMPVAYGIPWSVANGWRSTALQDAHNNIEYLSKTPAERGYSVTAGPLISPETGEVVEDSSTTWFSNGWVVTQSWEPFAPRSAERNMSSGSTESDRLVGEEAARAKVNKKMANGEIRPLNTTEQVFLDKLLYMMARAKFPGAARAAAELRSRQYYIDTTLPTNVPGPDGPETTWGRTYPTIKGLERKIFLNPMNFDPNGGFMLDGELLIRLARTGWHENFHIRYPDASESTVKALTRSFMDQMIDDFYRKKR